MFMFVILVEQSENTFLLFSQIQSASKLIVCFRHGSNGYVPEKQFGIHQGLYRIFNLVHQAHKPITNSFIRFPLG